MKADTYVGLEDIYKKAFFYKEKTGYINAATILKFVSEKNSVSIDTLKSSTRKREVVQVRQQYVWLYRALLVKRGIVNSMGLKTEFIKIDHKVSNNVQLMKLINKSHCLADHCWKQYETLFFSDKELEKQSKELLDELDKLII